MFDLVRGIEEERGHNIRIIILYIYYYLFRLATVVDNDR